MSKISTQSGFALVFMIVIVGAVSMSVSLLLATQAWESNRTQQAVLSSLAARYAAEGCLEYGLLQVRDDNFFTGTVERSIDGIPCSVTVSNEGGEVRQLIATASDQDHHRTVTATTTAIRPQLETRWFDN